MSECELKYETKRVTAIRIIARKYGFDPIELAKRIASGRGFAYRLFLKQMAA
jgi:hypothetical protein